MLHMKFQDLFSLKNKYETTKILLGALWVNIQSSAAFCTVLINPNSANHNCRKKNKKKKTKKLVFIYFFFSEILSLDISGESNAADDILSFSYFSDKQVDISCEMSAQKMLHMKCQEK